MLSINADPNTGSNILSMWSQQVPAGFTSEKNVPIFFPSTMSEMTCPVTLGSVPLAMTTEVPP